MYHEPGEKAYIMLARFMNKGPQLLEPRLQNTHKDFTNVYVCRCEIVESRFRLEFIISY